MKLFTRKCFVCLDRAFNGNLPTMKQDRFLPEEGVMLNADLPQLLGSSVVRKLKTNCTFKLFILEGRKERGQGDRQM